MEEGAKPGCFVRGKRLLSGAGVLLCRTRFGRLANGGVHLKSALETNVFARALENCAQAEERKYLGDAEIE